MPEISRHQFRDRILVICSVSNSTADFNEMKQRPETHSAGMYNLIILQSEQMDSRRNQASNDNYVSCVGLCNRQRVDVDSDDCSDRHSDSMLS